MERRKFIQRIALLGGGIALSGFSSVQGYSIENTRKNGYQFAPKNIKYDKSWDVIIVGGGPSGCAAAIAAAREGARTLLIEAMGALGGMGTLGLIPAWCPFTDKEKIIYRGIAERVLMESKKGVPHISRKQLDWVPIHAEYLKKVYDDMVLSSGAKVLFYTRVADVVKNADDEIDTIIVANKNGLTAYKAKIYVDCTGDGDISAWAGASFQKGDEKGMMQSATLCFMLDNVNKEAYQNTFKPTYEEMKKSLAAMIATKKYPLLDTHFNNVFVTQNSVQFNAGHIHNMDGTDAEKLSAGAIKGRKIAEEALRALRETYPDTFGQSSLTNTASLVGIREGRRILGDYTLTIDDWKDRRTFEDEIGRNCYYIDVHSKKVSVPRYKKGESHGIPYRVLTPKGMKNLLTAGRCISADHLIYGSVRIMPASLVTGEAAGMAAAHAVLMSHPDVHNVDVQKLRKRLKDEGQYFL